MELDFLYDSLSKGFAENGPKVDLLRLDLFEPDIPGNKYFKMKYNIEVMKGKGLEHLVTFGGAFSNHIAAVAQAGRKYGFKTTGIIRGEAESASNPTLHKAAENGMDFRFIDRSTYREWKKGKVNLDEYLGLKDYYLLPEGGSNILAVKGCAEIMNGTENYDLICCPVGTGATLAGLIIGSKTNQQILGFSNMKGGEYIREDIGELLAEYDSKFGTDHKSKSNWTLIHDYHFGGFAKGNVELLNFFRTFQSENNIELDLIYTAKMMYGLRDLLNRGILNKYKNILAIHTGGQQGNPSLKARISDI